MFDPRKRLRKRTRKSQTKKPTRNWFAILLTVIFWTLTILTIIFVDPDLIKDMPFQNSYLSFFILIAATLAITFWLIFLNLKRTFLYTSITVFFLFLRLNGQGHFLNAILLISLLAAFEYYFGSSQKPKTTPSVTKNKSS